MASGWLKTVLVIAATLLVLVICLAPAASLPESALRAQAFIRFLFAIITLAVAAVLFPSAIRVPVHDWQRDAISGPSPHSPATARMNVLRC